MDTPKFEVSGWVVKLLETVAQLKKRICRSLIQVLWVPSLVQDAMVRAAGVIVKQGAHKNS